MCSEKKVGGWRSRYLLRLPAFRRGRGSRAGVSTKGCLLGLYSRLNLDWEVGLREQTLPKEPILHRRKSSSPMHTGSVGLRILD